MLQKKCSIQYLSISFIVLTFSIHEKYDVRRGWQGTNHWIAENLEPNTCAVRKCREERLTSQTNDAHPQARPTIAEAQYIACLVDKLAVESSNFSSVLVVDESVIPR